MRWMRFFILLLMLQPVQVVAQQYSDGACLLLQQQIDRFSEQRSNPNYRSARREYDKYCLNRNKAKPVAKRDSSAATEPVQAEKPVTQPPAKTSAAQSSQSELQQAESTSTPRQNTAEKLSDQSAQAAISETQQGAEVGVQPVKATLQDNTDAISQSGQRSVAEDAAGADIAATTTQAAHRAVPPSVPDTATEIAAQPGTDNDLLMQVLTNLPQASALLFALLSLLFLLTSWLGLNLPGFKGVFAEYKLYRILRWRLSKDHLHFRKLRLYTANDEPTLIDHLVLSRSGIFVIAVCSYRGSISGSVSIANWVRQYLGSRKQFMNPLHQNFKNTEAVKHLLQLRGTEVMEHMHSVIAFTRLAHFDTAIAENVTFLDDVAGYINRFNEPVISETQYERFAALLQQAESGQQR